MPRPGRRAEKVVVKVSEYTRGRHFINLIFSIQVTMEKFAAGPVNSTSNFTGQDLQKTGKCLTVVKKLH